VQQTEEGTIKVSQYGVKSRTVTVNTTHDYGIRSERLAEPIGSSPILSEEPTVQYESLQEEVSWLKKALHDNQLLYERSKQEAEQRFADLKQKAEQRFVELTQEAEQELADSKQEAEQKLAYLEDDFERHLKELEQSHNRDFEKQEHLWRELVAKWKRDHDNDCNELRDDHSRILRQNQAHKDSITGLESKIGRLEEDNRRLNSEVIRAQKYLLKKAEQSAWISEPDSTIKDKFTNLAQSINKFAKKFAMTGWSPRGTRDQELALEDYLEPIVRHVIVNDKNHFPSEILERTANASAFCVGASLAHLLSRSIFRSPFWFLEEEALQPNGIYKSLLDGEGSQFAAQLFSVLLTQ